MKSGRLPVFLGIAIFVVIFAPPSNSRNVFAGSKDDEGSTTERQKWTWPPWLTFPSSLPTIPPGWTDWTPGGPFPTLPPGVTLLPPEWIEDAKVEIADLGTIQGGVSFTSPVTAPTRRKFYWFSGIPFADPTSYTGKNRFKPSKIWKGELPKNQNGVYAAINPFFFCPQENILPFSTDLGEVLTAYYANGTRTRRENRKKGIKPQAQGVEECLVINVSTPKLPKKSGTKDDDGDNELLPVIFFIHGGSFDAFLGGVFGGHRFLNRDVLLVSVNYRLGALGSLNLGIDDAPGNAAMYDMITALKWVKKYIHHWGGDKNRVIVSGHSAGSVMASHLLTTKLIIDDSDGTPLIHGLIGLSGSSFSQWATCTDPMTHNLRVAKYAGCYSGGEGDELTVPDRQKIRDCMADLSIPELIEAMGKYTVDERLDGRLGYDAKVPSLQDPANLKEVPVFLSDTPYEIVQREEQLNIPIMMGTARHDGVFVMQDTYYDYLEPNNYTNDAVFLRNEFIYKLMEALGLGDPSGEMIHSLIHTYLGETIWEDDFKPKIPGLTDLHSVFGFKAGAYGLVEAHSKLNPNSYYFSFEYDGLWSLDGGPVIPGGVGHANPVFYLFQAFPLIIPADQAVAYRFTDYWVNFAIYGDPNGEAVTNTAAPYNGLNHPYLIIDRFDSTGYYCRDGWVNNSLELQKQDPTTSPPTTPLPSTSSTAQGGESTPQPTTDAITGTTTRSTTPSRAHSIEILGYQIILPILFAVVQFR